MLFDAHCHVQRDDALVLAREAGVAGLACCGTGPRDWAEVGRLAAGHPGCLAQYGLHPWYLPDEPEPALDELARRLRDDPRAGVGEIGVDRAADAGRAAFQLDLFERQLALAKDLKRPVSIHCRRAWNALIPALQRFMPMAPGFVMHSFSGPPEVIAKLVRMGGYFSFSGTLTYPNNRRGPLAARAVPIDRLLIETDAPDMLPYGIGEGAERPANTSVNLPIVFRRMAELRDDVAEAELERALWENAMRLFGGVAA